VLGSFAATRQSCGVFVEVDEALALAPVERMGRVVTYGGMLAAALALAAALLLGTLISRPITRLAAISKRLADGDFSVEARASRVSELDTLAVNFNRMAARLGELVERFRAAAREANDMFLGTIRALAEAIDEKDPYTKGHSVRVNRYAVIIGRYLGLSREEMRNLQISSLLHDVGKIGIDDAILKKPAALSPDEFHVMKTHPERGAKIMGRIPQMRNIIPGMRFHHERWGGGGYPMGLRREEIPLQARIIAVADTFDAMITDRPYQKALPIAEAVARINELKGMNLDPQVVEAFNRAHDAGEFDDIVVGRPARASESIPPPPVLGPSGAEVADARLADAFSTSPTIARR
jgi:HD-GYP domain-containing protein (c-di-GMP phosphodiesterase class II)